MHLGMRTTPLTPAERLLIRDILGDDWRPDEIRIAEGGILDWIFQVNGGLAFATWMTVHLPRGKGGNTAVTTCRFSSMSSRTFTNTSGSAAVI
jgi:hypothetical protein